jgi:PPOX class probable F420-dependent enzyme
MTHRAGAELVAAAPTGALDDLDRRKYCTVVSCRRDREAVSTPVWFGTDVGKLYFRSLAGAYKLKRIARDDRVRVAPCTRRGRPVGPPFEGRARILEPAEAEAAERRIQANYGAFGRL